MHRCPFGDNNDLPLVRFTSAIEIYRVLLGIRSVKPVGSNELHLEYEPLASTGEETRGTVTLALLFDETTRRLEDAKVGISHTRFIVAPTLTHPSVD